jgi:Zinc finger, C3HC4 type (RING finger)
MSSSPDFARPSDPRSTFWSTGTHSTDPSGHSPDRSTTLPDYSHIYRQRPRLSSPRLFPPDFLTLPTPNTAARTHSFARPFRDTLNDINRALESANTAIQDAHEAFVLPELAHIREHRAMPPVVDLVDLTAASPSQSPELQRHHPSHTVRHHTNIMTLLNGFPPDYDPNLHPIPMNRYAANRLPELRGDFPDHDAERAAEPTHRRHRIDRQLMQRHTIGEPFALFAGRQERLDPREREQQAIQRQRDARAQWDSNQWRREAAITQRSRSRSPHRSSPPVRQRSEGDVRPGSSGSRLKSESPVESIDLTTVDENVSASDILAKQREDAVASQRLSSENGRTRLTSYKCPICMETPTDITATTCGHLFCHRCIIESLKWSEEHRGENMPHTRPKGVCPVCRKEMRRIDTDERGRTLVPLNAKKSKQTIKRTKEDVKGKGVARDVPQESKIRESSSELMGRFVNLDND